jgi:hypothetical protein
MLNRFFDFKDRRTEAAEIAGRLQAVNTATARATKTTKINRIGPTGKISDNKTMPPKVALTMGATGRLFPGK